MMNYKCLFGTILALSSLPVICYGQENQIDCQKASTQSEINICAQRQAQAADKKLNNTYQILQRKLAQDLRQGDTAQINSAKQRYQRLINAQNAWIKFRDTTCEYERSSVEGGSIAPTIYYGCIAKFTDRRTADLQDYIQLKDSL